MTRPKSKRRQIVAGVLLALAVVAGVVASAPRLGLLGAAPIVEFPAQGAATRHDVAAVFLSGDMGFHFGMGAEVAGAIAARGIPVVGVSSPANFAHHRTRAEADAIVADAIRSALQRTGARRVILLGQSYGADIVATVAPDLPPDLRARIAAIDLTVPAQDVYFRADPSGIAYLGAPDARPMPALLGLLSGPHRVPFVCVYGLEETGSLCPVLKGTGAQVIGLTGNHYLNHDPARVIATTLAALRAAVPDLEI